MKRLLTPLTLVALLIASCKEVGPAIDFGPKAADTSFMATVETPQQRVVVMEEFTGVDCGPCFLAHKTLKKIEDDHAGRVAILGIQASGAVQSNPLDSPSTIHPGVYTRHDNRTAVGTAIANQLYGGVSTLPQAGIDRTNMSGAMLAAAGNWAAIVDSRLAVASPVRMTVTSDYDAGARRASIKVHVAYTQAVAKTQLLSVALIENEVIDAQNGGDTVNYTQDYHHQHVLRDILTAPVGSVILGAYSTKSAGLVYERTFIYSVNTAWNPANCKVVAYISNNEGADKEVVQGAETPLKP